MTYRPIIINGIVNILNNELKAKNKELCKQNLHCDQVPLHGFNMLLKLNLLTDDELTTIAKLVGL